MGFIIQNTDTKKFLVKKNGPLNLTVANKEAATVFSNESEANKEAANFDPYKLIEI